MIGIGAGPAVAAIVTSSRMKRERKKLVRDDVIPTSTLSEQKQAIIESVEQQLKEENLKQSKRICPECGRNFSEIIVEDITLETCIFCRSLWFDLDELKKLTGLLDDIPGMRLADRESKLKCPVCTKQMFRKIFIQGSNLVVDSCRDHGVYLENGELTRALELSE